MFIHSVSIFSSKCFFFFFHSEVSADEISCLFTNFYWQTVVVMSHRYLNKYWWFGWFSIHQLRKKLSFLKFDDYRLIHFRFSEWYFRWLEFWFCKIWGKIKSDPNKYFLKINSEKSNFGPLKNGQKYKISLLRFCQLVKRLISTLKSV